MTAKPLATAAGIFISVLITIGLALGCSGCKTSAERQVYRATGTTINTANAAMDVWFAYVTAEERKLKGLSQSNPSEYMARRRKLVLDEGKVAGAWDTYVKAQKAFILGAAALGPGESPDSPELQTLRKELIDLVTSLTK